MSIVYNKRYLVPKGLWSMSLYQTRYNIILKAGNPIFTNTSAYIISYDFNEQTDLSHHTGFFISNSHAITLDLDSILLGQFTDQRNNHIQEIQMNRQSIVLIDYIPTSEDSIDVVDDMTTNVKIVKELAIQFVDGDGEVVHEASMSSVFSDKGENAIMNFARHHYIIILLIVLALCGVGYSIIYCISKSNKLDNEDQYNSLGEIDKEEVRRAMLDVSNKVQKESI